MGQWLRVIGKDVFLKVISVESETSSARVTKGQNNLKKGWEVEIVPRL